MKSTVLTTFAGMFLQPLLFALLILVVPLIVVYLNRLSRPLRGIELVGPKSEGWTSWKAGEIFNSKAISILQEGLQRVTQTPSLIPRLAPE